DPQDLPLRIVRRGHGLRQSGRGAGGGARPSPGHADPVPPGHAHAHQPRRRRAHRARLQARPADRRMKVAVTGAAGQLGRALVSLLGPRAAWSGGRDALDVSDPVAVARMLDAAGPDVVINAAAFNDVDGAEADPTRAMAVNAVGAGHLARACREHGALLVHVSSDYVFDGAKREPYREDDCPAPLNVYGVSKLAGGLLVAASGANHLIVRTSGVFGAGGNRVTGGSFVARILARAHRGQPLRVVNDQVFSPTYAPDL